MRCPRATTSVLVAASALIVLLTGTAATAAAQDPVKVAPKNFKVLLENDHVRVLDFHTTSGAKIPMHSHPAYISYNISGSGKTKFTTADGKTKEQAAAAGQAIWHDAETHASEYEGTGTAHVVLVELKGGAK